MQFFMMVITPFVLLGPGLLFIEAIPIACGTTTPLSLLQRHEEIKGIRSESTLSQLH